MEYGAGDVDRPTRIMTLTSVYIHFPWCARKCPYCDFTTYPKEPSTVPSEGYADSVLRELALRAQSLKGRTLGSVFFGGGTPSLWSPVALARVLRGVFEAFDRVAEDLEVTAECNPNSFNQDRATALLDGGVNRLSLGVQSLRDRHLDFLGRLHNANEALAALSIATRTVPRVSADLMFGLPTQTVIELCEDIGQLVDAGAAHVSAYALTIEAQTPFGALHRKGLLKVASDDCYADLFEAAESAFADKGFTHYEVSNYARTAEESRHNQHYWRGGAYLGLGVGAVGCLDAAPGAARRWRNEPDPERYMAARTLDSVEQSEERLGPVELNREALMLGLRTVEGVDLAQSRRRSGQDVRVGREAAIEQAIDRGDLKDTTTHFAVPRDKWLKLDAIVRDLF